jgi:hypothetical protein
VINVPKGICIKCGEQSLKDRKYCRKCFNLRVGEQLKNRGGRYGISNCKNCGKEIRLWKKNQRYCKSCHLICRQNQHGKLGKYIYDGERHVHRLVAESIVGRKLEFNEVVHHIDENPKNFSARNLLIMSRVAHTKLHWFLFSQKTDNCVSDVEWDNLRRILTFSFLKETNTIFIDLTVYNDSDYSYIPRVNCHRSRKVKFQKDVAPKTNKIKNKCIYCGKEFDNKRNEFCSQECAHKAQQKLKTNTEEEIQEFISYVNKMPLRDVAKIYGVSDKAVAKRCNKLNIERPKQGFWLKK